MRRPLFVIPLFSAALVGCGGTTEEAVSAAPTPIAGASGAASSIIEPLSDSISSAERAAAAQQYDILRVALSDLGKKQKEVATAIEQLEAEKALLEAEKRKLEEDKRDLQRQKDIQSVGLIGSLGVTAVSLIALMSGWQTRKLENRFKALQIEEKELQLKQLRAATDPAKSIESAQ